MTNQSADSPSGHTVRLDLDWRWHRPKHRPNIPKGEPRDDERPIRCIEGATTLAATTTSLPYLDASCHHVDCSTVFAYIRNDEGLARELCRVVQPGGSIRIRVPATGLLAGLDAFNIHRYLVDMTKRGLRPFETADIGWRRHYGQSDLDALVDPAVFSLFESDRTGIAAAEAVRLVGFVLFRWLRPSRDRYRAISAYAERVQAEESVIAWSQGFWLEAIYVRKENAPADKSEARSV